MNNEKEVRRRSSRLRPPTTIQESDDVDDNDPHNELTRLRRIVARQRARNAIKAAKYREKNREKVLAAKKRYRETHRDQEKAYRRRYRQTHRDQQNEIQKRYREKHRDKIVAAKKRYYQTHRDQENAYRRRYREAHREQIRAKQRERWKRAQDRARHRRDVANQRRRTAEKVKALGPLTLTVRLTDYLKSPSVNTPEETYLDTFCQSLPSDNVSRVDQPEALTLTDMDSGERRPLDQPVWVQELDDLMEDLHDVMEDSLETCLYDLLKDMSPDDWGQLAEDMQDPSFHLDDFVSMFPDDDMNDVIEDMSLNEWEQFMEDVLDSFDLDDFVT